MPGRSIRSASALISLLALTALPLSAQEAQPAPPAQPQQPTQPAPAAQPARREPGISLGEGARITFLFKPRVMSDNNIFLSGEDEAPDWSVNLASSAQLTIRRQNFRLSAGGGLEEWKFMDHGSADRTETRFNGSVALDEGLFYLNAGGNFARVAQPVDVGGTSLVVIRQATGNVTVGFKLGQALGFEGETASNIRFEGFTDLSELTSPIDTLEFYEHQSWFFGARLRAPFVGGRVNTYLEAGGGHTDFVNFIKDDHETRRIRLGANWRVLDQESAIGEVTLDGAVGYETRDYITGSGTTAFSEDFYGYTGSIGLSWAPWTPDRFSLGFEYEPRESTLCNFNEAYAWRFGYTHKFGEDWAAVLTASWTSVEEGNGTVVQRYKQQRSAQVSLFHTFNPDIVGEVTFLIRDKATDDEVGEYDDQRMWAGMTIRF